MARLYGEIHTDRNTNEKHFIANEKFFIELFYGSKDNSIRFAKVYVVWEKGMDKPKLEVIEE